MKTPKLAALAFALFAAWGNPAPAATIDYALTIPLVDISATDLTATTLLTGTLSYDDSGDSTFSVVNSPDGAQNVYTGSAWLLALGSQMTGILFDGFYNGSAELYFNIVASADATSQPSGQVNYCPYGCSMFQSVGATVKAGVFTPVVSSGGVSLPGAVVSPVPLPPAATLFGGALLALAGLGAGRRLALRPQLVKRK